MTQRQSANLCVCHVGGVVKVDLWSAREVSKCECVPNTPLRPRLPAIAGRRSTGVHSATMSMHWSCGASTVLSNFWILVMRLSISTGCPPPLSGRLAVGGNMYSCMFSPCAPPLADQVRDHTLHRHVTVLASSSMNSCALHSVPKLFSTVSDRLLCT